MRARLTMHYAVLFFFAGLVLIFINIFYMRSYVYRDTGLYYFDEGIFKERVLDSLYVSTDGKLVYSEELDVWLEAYQLGFRIMDDHLNDVLEANVALKIESPRTLEQAITLYNRKDITVFVDDFFHNGATYTLLLFFDPQHISRMSYTYDVKRVGQAYNIYWLIGMNLLILIMLSYAYTHRVSRPIHRVIDRIVALSKGNYEIQPMKKGLYEPIERAMNVLANELQASQKEREAAQATREEWIVNLSHDIKTPLTSIVGYGELLGDDVDLTHEEKERYKGIILEKGAYIQKLIDDLNFATRLKHHHKPLVLEKVDIILEVKHTVIDVLNTCLHHEHSVSMTFTQDHIFCAIDRQLFGRMLRNVVENAISHNKESVHILVHVDTTPQEQVVITVDDNGVGVNDLELPHLFSRYYRGSYVENETPGTGLGLAIAKDIAMAHGGSISAEKSSRNGLKIMIFIGGKNEKTL